jgi:hypothetical protein
VRDLSLKILTLKEVVVVESRSLSVDGLSEKLGDILAKSKLKKH